MAETKEIYVKVTVDEKGEITVNASIGKEHALKLLNEGITVCVDAIIEENKRAETPETPVEVPTILTTEE